MFDVNIDQAILHARTDAAQLSGCASAVDHRGRREVVARDHRCRRAEPIPAANDDEHETKPIIDTLRHLRDNPLKETLNGRDHTAS